MLDLPEGVTAWREKDVLHLEMTHPRPPAPDPVGGGAGLGETISSGCGEAKKYPRPLTEKGCPKRAGFRTIS